jgi:hypothetical protein
MNAIHHMDAYFNSELDALKINKFFAMKNYLKILLTSLVLFSVSNSGAQSHIELGLGLPLQQFEYLGSRKIDADRIGFAFEGGYGYKLNRLTAGVSIQYAHTVDAFRKFSPFNNSIYSGDS